MNRKVIYTCLTGGYDRLQQPGAVAPDWDYVCFTDGEGLSGNGREGVWELRRIPFGSPDPATCSRYPKLLPHEVLPEYDYSLYLDANLCIADAEFYRIADRLIADGTLWAQVPHPQRDCVYDELRYCYLKGKIATRTAFRLHRAWTSARLPRHAGLYENNLIFRAHNAPQVRSLDTAWWQAFLTCDGRDQLALMPAALLREGFPQDGSHGPRPVLLLGPGTNARNTPLLKYTLHPPTGKENTPGRLTWGNLVYHLRLGWRKMMLPFLK